MCCRYYMELSPELRPYIEAANRSPLKGKIVDKLARPMVTSGEVRPTDLVPVIASNKAMKPAVFPMVWGFHLPRYSSPIVNARVETAMEKEIFKESWEHRRCIIPASYYFEWEHLKNAAGKAKTGDKYMIQPQGSRLTFMAGLYRIEEIKGIKIPVFTILTRAPVESIRFIHDRMPVILLKESIREWVNPSRKPEKILKDLPVDVLFEKVV